MHSLYATTKFLAIELVTIAQQVSWCRIVRKRFDHLVCRPKGRGMLGHIEVNHAAAVMSQHHQDQQHSKCRRGHGEEIKGGQIRTWLSRKALQVWEGSLQRL